MCVRESVHALAVLFTVKIRANQHDEFCGGSIAAGDGPICKQKPKERTV